ncbi:MAG: DHA2 family efflux MFS transporter permease subunit [Arthrobacter sp.]|uniref:DHA2 family efflux MFS transporter permease subunit n=1 Tax=Arthrobacter TaxID=1663 RepID=UPI003FB9B7CC
MKKPQPNKWAALAVLAAGLSMIVLDGTIVGVSLPTIITDLGLDLGDAQWVNSLYSVVLAALLLSAGRLGDRVGRRKLFVAGVVLFMAGSLFSAMADSSSSLILGRAIQGVGGAAVLPSTLASVNANFQGRDRAAAFGVWGAVMSGMAAVGPLLGGWLSSSVDWRWIFLVNLPFGLLILVGTVLFVPETSDTHASPGFDVVGLLLSASAFGLLVFALIEGPTLGWWTPQQPLTIGPVSWPAGSSPVIPLAVTGVVLLAAFLGWQGHRATVGKAALLDLTLFRISTFSWGNTAAAAVAVGEFGLLLVLPLFLVNVLETGTLGAGLILAAMALGAFGSGAAARHLADLMGAARVVILGLALEVVGVLVLAIFTSNSLPIALLVPVLVVYGLGLGLASAQLTGTVLRDIPTEASGEASATQSTVRQIGSGLGSAIAGTILAVATAASAMGLLRDAGADEATATKMASGLSDSAGGLISSVNPANPLHDALTAGFATGVQWSLFGAAAFLILGLIASFRVASAARLTGKGATGADAGLSQE